MEAFLDLVVQYHKDLGAGDSTPVAEAVDALEKLQNNLSKFYGGWTDLKKYVEVSEEKLIFINSIRRDRLLLVYFLSIRYGGIRRN